MALPGGANSRAHVLRVKNGDFPVFFVTYVVRTTSSDESSQCRAHGKFPNLECVRVVLGDLLRVGHVPYANLKYSVGIFQNVMVS